MICGLIFDVDGVIADSESVNSVVSIEVFERRFGIKGVRPENFFAGLGRGAEAYLLAAAKVHKLDLSAEELDEAVEMRQALFLEHLQNQGITAYPGVHELMETAGQDQRFKLAIATSSTREKSQSVLRAAKINFEDMVYISGNDVTHKKPDPEVFTQAIEKLHIPARYCVVIEDAPNGIEAAHAAGACCVAVTNTTSAEQLAGADLIVRSLTELCPSDLLQLVSI